MSFFHTLLRRLSGKQQPRLSVIVNFYNMQREARRTLYSLSARYQQGVNEDEYEVIVVDNGSTAPLDAGEMSAYGRNFRYLFFETTSVSPAAAMNFAVSHSRAEWITLCIDGARIVSPGVLYYTLAALQVYPCPVVALLSWHLGDKLQNESVADGYNQEFEDKLLASVNWRKDGYRLFSVSTLAGSCSGGWFQPFAESNCLTMSRALLAELGGLDERFQCAGGGLLNLDIYKRACEHPDTKLVVLLGEGNFHQLHGGVATNAGMDEHPWHIFAREYEEIRGKAYCLPEQHPCYVGTLHPCARPVLLQSARLALEASAESES